MQLASFACVQHLVHRAMADHVPHDWPSAYRHRRIADEACHSQASLSRAYPLRQLPNPKSQSTHFHMALATMLRLEMATQTWPWRARRRRHVLLVRSRLYHDASPALVLRPVTLLFSSRSHAASGTYPIGLVRLWRFTTQVCTGCNSVKDSVHPEDHPPSLASLARNLSVVTAPGKRSQAASDNLDHTPLDFLPSLDAVAASSPFSVEAPSFAQGSPFQIFCQHTFRLSMRGHVDVVLATERQASESSTISFMDSQSELSSEETPESEAERAIRMVDLLGEFVEGAREHLPACFPPEWPTMEMVLAPVQHALLEIIYAAATDSQGEWSFALLLQLEAAMRACLNVVDEFGATVHPAAVDTAATIDSSMQVRISAVARSTHTLSRRATRMASTATHVTVPDSVCTSLSTRSVGLQLVYTAMGKLGQQLLMSAIDAATSNGMASLQLDDSGDQASLPDCIEILRMVDQQVRQPRRLTQLQYCPILLQLTPAHMSQRSQDSDGRVPVYTLVPAALAS